MSFFSSEFSAPKTLDKPQCKCGAPPKQIVRKMTFCMFECQCGERSWTEAKE